MKLKNWCKIGFFRAFRWLLRAFLCIPWASRKRKLAVLQLNLPKFSRNCSPEAVYPFHEKSQKVLKIVNFGRKLVKIAKTTDFKGSLGD